MGVSDQLFTRLKTNLPPTYAKRIPTTANATNKPLVRLSIRDLRFGDLAIEKILFCDIGFKYPRFFVKNQHPDIHCKNDTSL